MKLLKPTILLAGSMSLISCSKTEEQRPNIILIMADDIGISDIGCYGSEIQTPNIDRLAHEGLRFTTFYNMAKCNPTRSSLLTGLYKGGNGAVHIAQLTKEAGYFNIMSGKEHFDKWVPDYCAAEKVFDHSFYFWATTEYFLPPSGNFQRPFYLEGIELKSDEIDFEKMKKLGVLPENTKLSQAEGNLNKFRGPLIPAYTDYYPWNSLTEEQKDSLDLEMSVFAAIIDRMDQNIGRVLTKLQDNGKLENTLIMFLADNGSCPFYSNKIKDVQPGPANSYWSLRSSWANLGNTPYRQYKQSGYEGGRHTPFIAYWPGIIQANTITHQPGHVIDIVPTFLDILNIAYPDSINGYSSIPLHGKSLLPVFNSDIREEPDYFISGLEKFRMFRSGDYKIVKFNDGEWELYNIINDPSETENLAEIFPDTLIKLSVSYEEVRKKLNY